MTTRRGFLARLAAGAAVLMVGDRALAAAEPSPADNLLAYWEFGEIGPKWLTLEDVITDVSSYPQPYAKWVREINPLPEHLHYAITEYDPLADG